MAGTAIVGAPRDYTRSIDDESGDTPTAGLMGLCGGVGAGVGGAVAGPPGMLIGSLIGSLVGKGIYKLYRASVIRHERRDHEMQSVRLALVQVEAGREVELSARLMTRDMFEDFIDTVSRQPMISINLDNLKRVRTILWDTKFAPEDLSRLAQRMNVGRLEKLVLSSLGIKPRVAADFAAAIRRAENLTQLDLSHNELGGAGFGFLQLTGAHPALCDVNLSHCSLTVSHLISRGDGFMPLMLEDADRPEHPVKLSLSGNKIGGRPEELAHFRRLHGPLLARVTEVDLRGTDAMSGTAYSFARAFRSLTGCQLASSRYTGGQLSSLIQEWRASRTPLRTLDMSRSLRLDEAFFTELTQLLEETGTLTHLHLNHSTVSLVSRQCMRAFGRALIMNDDIHHVELLHTGMSRLEMRALNEGLMSVPDSTSLYSPETKGLEITRPGGTQVTIFASWDKLLQPNPLAAARGACRIM